MLNAGTEPTTGHMNMVDVNINGNADLVSAQTSVAQEIDSEFTSVCFGCITSLNKHEVLKRLHYSKVESLKDISFIPKDV